jgi:hypothetical protein
MTEATPFLAAACKPAAGREMAVGEKPREMELIVNNMTQIMHSLRH